MSELGQNEGQEQNEKATFFDSAKISEKKDVEHFSNVEGAEERAKAAERARKAAEKEAAEVHAADVRAAAEQMKKTEDKQSGKKGGILGFLFGGWHKIVTIVVVLVLIVGGVLLCMNMCKTESYETRKEKDIAAREAAARIEDDARVLVDIESSEEKYAEAKKIYEDAIKNSDKRQAVFLKIEYAEFVYDNTSDFSAAIDILGDVKADIDTEIAAEFYNYRVKMLYFEAGASEEFQEVSVRAE